MLYILRHGQTDWNIQYRLQGGIDIPLNDKGRKMAADAAEKYKTTEFDICFCSPLSRARETADLFLKGRNIDIIEDDRLKEMSFGSFEGDQYVLNQPDHPVYKLFKDPAFYEARGGAETIEELCSRTGAFMEEKVKPLLTENKNVLIVGHGAMNSSIICRWRGLDNSHFWDGMTDNCELVDITHGAMDRPVWKW